MNSDPINFEGRILSKYTVVKEIGRGNMARVYLGHEPFVDRDVAIKIADAEHLRDPTDTSINRKVFFNEAMVAGMLKHPNITAIHDAGQDGDAHYIVMEYVPGGKTVDDYCRIEQLLSIKDVIGIIIHAAQALDHAHRQGVIHRDIKPRNLLLTPSMEVKLSDFGIALAPNIERLALTDRMGSPKYMSPEHVRGEPVNGQADLFSLGIVMYEMLTGRHPFAAENLSAIQHRLLNSRHPPLRDFRAEAPDVLERIVDRCLAKNRAKRYASGMDLAGDLNIVIDILESSTPEAAASDKLSGLRQFEPFRKLGEQDLWEMVHASTMETMPPGKEIITEGELDREFYIVLTGTVDVMKGGRKVDELGEGDCFGELGFLSGEQRTATVVAKTGVGLMKVRASVLERASINCQLRFHKMFLHKLVQRLSRSTDRIANLEAKLSLGESYTTPE